MAQSFKELKKHGIIEFCLISMQVMNDLIRPSLMEAYHGVLQSRLVERAKELQTMNCGGRL